LITDFEKQPLREIAEEVDVIIPFLFVKVDKRVINKKRILKGMCFYLNQNCLRNIWRIFSGASKRM